MIKGQGNLGFREEISTSGALGDSGLCNERSECSLRGELLLFGMASGCPDEGFNIGGSNPAGNEDQ